MMGTGKSARDTLNALLSEDSQSERRQVAMIDPRGEVAVHTRERCLPHASHVVGGEWVAIGNLLATGNVIPAMAWSYNEATGTLAERMVSALEAAEREGGDVRGRQSAAIRIAPGEADLRGRDEPGIDISVADHSDPLMELRRLVEVDRSYRALSRGEDAIAQGDATAAMRYLDQAAELRHGVEVDFWRAIGLSKIGHIEEAAATLSRVVREAPGFGVLLRRSLEAGDLLQNLEPYVSELEL